MKSSGNALIASLFKSSETTEERQKAAVEMKAALKSNNSNFFRKASQVGRFGKKNAKKEDPAKPAKKIPLWKQQNMRGAVKKEEKKERKKFTRVGSEKKRARLDTLGVSPADPTPLPLYIATRIPSPLLNMWRRCISRIAEVPRGHSRGTAGAQGPQAFGNDLAGAVNNALTALLFVLLLGC